MLQKLRPFGRVYCHPDVHCPSPATAAALVISALPFLLFLLVYGVNETTHVLPTFEDADSRHCGPQRVCVWNVGALETAVLGFAPHDVVSAPHWAPLDFLSAVPYLGHYVLPVFYPAALVFGADRPDCARRFYQLVGWSMWIIFGVWYVAPTAPPWYYDAVDPASCHNATRPSSPAGAPTAAGGNASSTRPVLLREGPAFARVDRRLGFGLFRSLFAGNPVPFASFPSGHVAWPTCAALTVPVAWRRAPFFAYSLLVVWATLYSRHHYLSDAVAAVAVTLTVHRLTTWINRLKAPPKYADVPLSSSNHNHTLAALP